MYHEDGGSEGGDNGRSAPRTGSRSEPRGDSRSDGRGEVRNGGRSTERRAGGADGRNQYSRPIPVSRDPFFDKPYEPSAAADAAPSWESAARPAVRSVSANIKPKRKVAALFKSE
jgi:hypothetical protein